jgi:hypothetical protein
VETKTKFCCRCKHELPIIVFRRKTSRKDGLQSYCKECGNKYHNEYYWKHKAEYYARAKAAKKGNRRRNQIKLMEFLRNNPCVDCGETDPILLEFDHIQGVKKAHISDLISKGSTWTRVMTEIDKCVIRCCKCHRKRTAKQFDWFRQRV